MTDCWWRLLRGGLPKKDGENRMKGRDQKRVKDGMKFELNHETMSETWNAGIIDMSIDDLKTESRLGLETY